MGATLYGNEMSENQERNNSCNSFADETFADDAPPPRSRNYCCNRFSSHAFPVVMVLAVYLLLPLGMTIAAETNETANILTNPLEEYISTAKQDVDNEISATLEENPISVDKTDFLESTLTENLEDTIRNSVKSQIEMEQTVGSPALLNAINVMTPTDNIVLVEYPGASNNTPKNEILIESQPESAVDTQCDASSLICLRPKKKDVLSSAAVNIIESTSTDVTDIDVSSTTTILPIELETTTILPESDVDEIAEQSPREGRTLDSENIVQEEEKNSISEAAISDINVLSQQEHETKPETLSNVEINLDSVLNNEEPEKINEPIEENLNPEEATSSILKTVLDDDKNAESTNSIHSADESESEIISEAVEPAYNEINETQLSILPIPNESSNTSHLTNENDLDESALQADNKTLIQNEIEISPIAVSKAHDSNINDSDLEEEQNIVQSPLNPESNDRNSEGNDQNQTDISSSQHGLETNTNDLDEQPSISLENSPSLQLSLTTTPSSETLIIQQTLDLVNETLSMIFEEPLSVNETSIEPIDDYVKTIIEMEDPAIIHTTVQPELTIHNVIKKQGVEPIDIEEPRIEIDTEIQSATLLPISEPVSESETIQSIENAVQPNEINENISISETENNTLTNDAIDTNATATKAQDITEVSVVFAGKVDDDASLNSKGSRSINALHSPLTGHEKASIHFDVYPAGQTFNENLAEELPNGIGRALPTHRLNEQSSNRSTLVIALCSGIALLFIIISVGIFMVSFQRQHGTLDIEMQERRDNINDQEAETCVKLLDIELPNNSLALQTDAEAEIEECL